MIPVDYQMVKSHLNENVTLLLYPFHKSRKKEIRKRRKISQGDLSKNPSKKRKETGGFLLKESWQHHRFQISIWFVPRLRPHFSRTRSVHTDTPASHSLSTRPELPDLQNSLALKSRLGFARRSKQADRKCENPIFHMYLSHTHFMFFVAKNNGGANEPGFKIVTGHFRFLLVCGLMFCRQKRKF